TNRGWVKAQFGLVNEKEMRPSGPVLVTFGNDPQNGPKKSTPGSAALQRNRTHVSIGWADPHRISGEKLELFQFGNGRIEFDGVFGENAGEHLGKLLLDIFDVRLGAGQHFGLQCPNRFT